MISYDYCCKGIMLITTISASNDIVTTINVVSNIVTSNVLFATIAVKV